MSATLAVPVAGSSAGAAPAEPVEPDVEWVQTSDDSVVRADTFRALNEGAQYESLVAGPGFNANDLRNFGSYTIRLVTSTAGNIEEYRAELQQMANEVNAAGGASLQVAAGTVAGPSNPNNLTPAQGEIWVMIAASSPCGPLSGGTLGCGGPYGWVSVNGELRWSSGTVWLSPTLSNACQQPVTNHEVSHALGLAHFDQQYLGQYQVMRSSTNCSFSALRAGDLNGHRWLVEGGVSNNHVAAADLVCALKDTTTSAVTWFATKEAGEPAHAGVAAHHSVWYRYTAQQAGLTEIKTTEDGDDDFDTVLAVYTGTMFSNVVPVISDDNSGGGVKSLVSFTATAGATYWIAVDGAGGTRGETDVVFNLPGNITPPPVVGGPPARLLDTRRPGGQTIDCDDQGVGRITAGATYELKVTSRAFVTNSAESVILNVTAVSPAAAGYVTVFPCGQTQPNASNLNFAAGDVIPNLVIAKVGNGGKVCLFTSATTDLLVDVSGFYIPTDDLTPLNAPGRLLDTRSPGGQTIDGSHQAVGQIPADGTYELPVINRANVPANATTVVLNVTAVGPTVGGYVTVFPCGQTRPNASNLNFVAGDVIPNAAIAKVGASGKVCFYSETATDLLVDVSGYFSPSPVKWNPLGAPARLLDTRAGGQTVDGLHQAVGRIPAGGTYVLPIAGRATVPPGAGSVVLNVTAVNPGAAGYITVYPCGQGLPNASNLNFGAGEVIPNAVITRVGTGGANAGKVCFFSSAETDLLVDVSGYFNP